MTQTSRPWQSTSPGDAGPYSAANWQEAWRYLIGLGAHRANAGVLLGSGDSGVDGLSVQVTSPVSANVEVNPGAALVHGTLYLSDAVETLAIAANGSGNPRIDTIILSKDFSAQTVRLAVLQGTPAVTPTPPSLTQTNNVLWEIPLADIAVADSFLSIASADISPAAEPANAADGVYLDMVLNNSGAELNTGDVVIWDTTADRSVTTTTTRNDPQMAGVWVGRTADQGYGRLQREGIGLVRTNAAVTTRGQYLTTSTTAKQATPSVVPGGSVARSLEITAGAGLCLAAIHVRVNPIPFAIIEDQKAQGTDGGTSTATTWTTRVLNTEVEDADSIVSISSNQFTPVAGRYRIHVVSPFRAAAAFSARIRLRNATTAAELVRSINHPLSIAGHAILEGYQFTANGTDAYDIQYFVTAGLATSGLGAQINEASAVERYTRVVLEKIG